MGKINPKSKYKLVLSIRSLDIGGAERQFIELVKNIDKKRFEVYVVTMYGGVQENEIKNIKEIKYFNLQKSGRYDLKFYFRYKELLNEIKPDVIYSFLGEMNLFSYWCKPIGTKLIWGFRSAHREYKGFSKFLFNLHKVYSKNVDKFVFNSNASLDFHLKQGFKINNYSIIHNGIDVNKFRRNEKIRKEMREKFNIKDDELVLGIVARIDKVKGYVYLAKALIEVLKNKKIKFIAVGGGEKNILKECQEILKDFKNQVYFVGMQKNTENFYNMFDVYISASLVEGFSNSIAEAMSSEVPCVVTDVGDSKIIIGELGEVVKPKSEDELIRGIKNILNKDLKNLGKLSRKRIIENFSIEKMVKKTEEEILKCVE